MKTMFKKSAVLLGLLLALGTAHAGDITGRVTCKGKGVPGVVVTDGHVCGSRIGDILKYNRKT